MGQHNLREAQDQAGAPWQQRQEATPEGTQGRNGI